MSTLSARHFENVLETQAVTGMTRKQAGYDHMLPHHLRILGLSPAPPSRAPSTPWFTIQSTAAPMLLPTAATAFRTELDAKPIASSSDRRDVSRSPDPPGAAPEPAGAPPWSLSLSQRSTTSAAAGAAAAAAALEFPRLRFFACKLGRARDAQTSEHGLSRIPSATATRPVWPGRVGGTLGKRPRAWPASSSVRSIRSSAPCQ